ncbi:MAG: tetratricopeptide repeat protein [Candidatus Uhrbacteria bacterium]|nr:tetratricopeptide repeat protein [Candidatus Uhrbacteria bacterium]
MFTLIAFIVSGVAFIVAGMVLAKRWKELRLLDPLSIKEERQRQKRQEVLERRFARLRDDQAEALKRVGRRIKHATLQTYHRTYERLQAFEALYRNVKSPFTTLAPTTREKIKTLLDEGRSLIRDLKWALAEQRFLEVLSIDPRHAEAFKGLGQIYLKQKLYPQAKETFEFLFKLNKNDDATHAALAEIAEAGGNLVAAENYRLKAVELNPRHAVRHAELASFYFGQQTPAKAWPSAKRAADLEPKSIKYLELSLEAAILTGNRGEARKSFDRLRLLADDQHRFQGWKEKIEAMEK